MTNAGGGRGRDEDVLLPFAQIRRSERPARLRWSLRAAQYRALQLARAAFGAETGVQLASFSPFGAYRGMLTLAVPFTDLEDHRRGEALFLRWAEEDPVLQEVPMVFVFQPEAPSRAAPRVPLRAYHGG